jgi:hypothetical protein
MSATLAPSPEGCLSALMVSQFGEKSQWTARPRGLFQAGEPQINQPLPPESDGGGTGLECSRDGPSTEEPGALVEADDGARRRPLKKYRAAPWQADDLKPHRTRLFNLSKDPNFVAKFWDIVGLYLTHRRRPWSSVATRKASARLWSAPSPAFP